ncbi:MAG: 30S ribosomal protein S8 [Candidatus Berkelbacteria bacterium]|nr:30S ribosomal protein S8 [Candidatus Berkelbacteria bacterium]
MKMDQIADLLTRIRNAGAVGKTELTVSFSKLKKAILDILQKEGFLSNVEIETLEERQSLKITISTKKAPTHLRLISKSGRRVYVKSKEIPKPLRGLGTVIISTSTGVTTGREASKKGIGGELICEIW